MEDWFKKLEYLWKIAFFSFITLYEYPKVQIWKTELDIIPKSPLSRYKHWCLYMSSTYMWDFRVLLFTNTSVYAWISLPANLKINYIPGRNTHKNIVVNFLGWTRWPECTKHYTIFNLIFPKDSFKRWCFIYFKWAQSIKIALCSAMF